MNSIAGPLPSVIIKLLLFLPLNIHQGMRIEPDSYPGRENPSCSRHVAEHHHLPFSLIKRHFKIGSVGIAKWHTKGFLLIQAQNFNNCNNTTKKSNEYAACKIKCVCRSQYLYLKKSTVYVVVKKCCCLYLCSTTSFVVELLSDKN